MEENKEILDKITRRCLSYINKNCMELNKWQYTKLNDNNVDSSLGISLESFEDIIIRFYLDKNRWYLLTNKWIFLPNGIKLNPRKIQKVDSGQFITKDNSIQKMIITINNKEIEMLYESNFASMAPIYYFKWWELKFPIMNILKDD